MTDLIDTNRVRFGPYEADLHTRELWKFGTRVKLVGQPFEILGVLLSRPGELVTRDELREKLWPGETFVDFNHGLNAAVNKLRDVLCDSAEDPKFIETLPRRGYRFIAKVERGTVEMPPAAPPVEVAPVGAPTPVVEPPPITYVPIPTVTAKKRHVWIAWTFAGVAACILLFATFLAILKMSSAWAERTRKQADEAAAMGGPLKGAQIVAATGGHNEGPQFSADGKKLVFMSDRAGGGKDLWIANASGGNPRQVTSLGSAGTPRWSPDGTKIAFDSEVNGRAVILIVNATGGQPTLAVSDGSNNRVPSWSHDGHYLYFSSDRTGEYEVWRMPAEGGPAQQMTRNGGFAAFDNEDGKVLFYAKSQFPNPDLWCLTLDGSGAENPVTPSVQPVTWASWGIAKSRLYFVEEGPGNVAMLSTVDLQTHKLRQVTMLGRFPFWLAVSSDGKKVAFDRVDSETTTSVVELEDFLE